MANGIIRIDVDKMCMSRAVKKTATVLLADSWKNAQKNKLGEMVEAGASAKWLSFNDSMSRGRVSVPISRNGTAKKMIWHLISPPLAGRMADPLRPYSCEVANSGRGELVDWRRGRG